MNTTIKDIENFWSDNPCDSFRSDLSDRKKYFLDIDKWRYENHPSILEIAQFNNFRNKRVLEIGCGIGTDGRRFAANGALYTGINLDESSTEMAQEAFNLFGLAGEISQMNAEKMVFNNDEFDHVYCMGVIHHTVNPTNLLNEAYRVLKPGGTMTAMVYNKSSINYYLEIMFLRKIFRYLLFPSFSPKLFAKFGFEYEKIHKHRKILFNGEKMTKDKWISINTDGPECPLSRVYSSKEITELFNKVGFQNIKTAIRFFNKSHYGVLGNILPNQIAEKIGKFLGWHLWVLCNK